MDAPRLLLLALSDKKAQGFRQFPQDQQRNRSDEEHRLPAVVRDEPNTEASRDHATDRISGKTSARP
jgi:hypothetical protein